MTTEQTILRTLPAWQHGERDESGELKPADLPRWFNDSPPPAIGSTINLRINSIGPAVVTGYWVESGFLGVVSIPVSPPAWYVRQNGDKGEGVAFGPEVSY